VTATAAAAVRGERPLRIGAVCDALREEFPDISISKIRYLEDQGLVHPSRTEGGYRLYRPEDVDRLRTILRLQRDEFLPLRVIREELAAPRRGRRDAKRGGRSGGLKGQLETPMLELDEFCERAGADPDFVRQLQQFRILRPAPDGRLPEADVSIVEACTRLLRFGIEPRNLGKFRSAADNQADLLAKAVAADLYARTPDRRERGLEDLEKLAADAVDLSRLLFWQALRSELAAS
jgi:DNA-binding transcriptional MerR regulator